MANRNAFGSVFRRPRPNGDGHFKGWYVRWTDHDGRRRQCKGGDTKAEAHDFLAKMRAERRHREIHGVAPVRKGTVAAVLREAWPIMCKPWAKSTERVQEVMMPIVVAEIGDRIVKDIRLVHVQALLDHLEDKRNLSPNGVKQYKKLLSAFFKAAIQLGYAEDNPTKGVVVRREQKKPGVRLTLHEQRLLLRHAEDEYRPLFALMIGTGMRVGEALGLRWSDIDGDTITVRRSGPKSEHTKTRRERRIPIGAQAREALETLRSRAVMPLRGVARVWQGAGYKTVLRALGTASENAGLTRAKTHDLRRAFAATVDQAGVSVFELMDLLGHADVKTTQTYVGRMSDERLRGAIGKLDELHHPRGSTGTRNSRTSSA